MTTLSSPSLSYLYFVDQTKTHWPTISPDTTRMALHLEYKGVSAIIDFFLLKGSNV
jgi:hypothetical protein